MPCFKFSSISVVNRISGHYALELFTVYFSFYYFFFILGVLLPEFDTLLNICYSEHCSHNECWFFSSSSFLYGWNYEYTICTGLHFHDNIYFISLHISEALPNHFRKVMAFGFIWKICSQVEWKLHTPTSLAITTCLKWTISGALAWAPLLH